jgi:hypothetical protein
VRSRLLVSLIILGSFLVCMPALGAVVVHSRHHHRGNRRAHGRTYIRHRTKMQHTKIIGGTALRGASVGGLIGGPPGSAVGAAAGAAVGTAYDLKTRKVKAPRR